MKICKICNEEKELIAYDKGRSTCRKCRNNKNRKSYFSKEGNIEKMREYQRVYQLKHKENNQYYKIYCKALGQIKAKLRSVKKNSIKTHLETLFTPEMNWENYGTYWEVDHIVSATKMAKAGYDIDEINKLSNLRPMQISDNRSRNKKE